MMGHHHDRAIQLLVYLSTGFSAVILMDISWEVGRVLALSGVPAAKDVGACCLLTSIGCNCVFDVLYIGLQI